MNGQTSTSCSGERMTRDGGKNGQTSTSCSAARIGRDGGTTVRREQAAVQRG